tara:strand:+ start:158 stop:337 length:180 start_codon:yes stop_codon:yes gene_type:complete
MAESDLDLVLHLGDYIYEYPEAGYANDYAREVLKRNVVPQHEIIALQVKEIWGVVGRVE